MSSCSWWVRKAGTAKWNEGQPASLPCAFTELRNLKHDPVQLSSQEYLLAVWKMWNCLFLLKQSKQKRLKKTNKWKQIKGKEETCKHTYSLNTYLHIYQYMLCICSTLHNIYGYTVCCASTSTCHFNHTELLQDSIMWYSRAARLRTSLFLAPPLKNTNLNTYIVEMPPPLLLLMTKPQYRTSHH